MMSKLSFLSPKLLAVPVAAGVTLGIFLVMQGLISKDFVPEEKVTLAKFVINAVPDDIEVLDQRRDIPEYETVETPPSPPIIERDTGGKPDSDAVNIFDDVPFIDKPDVIIDVSTVVKIDSDPTPFLRFEPVMPARFLAGNNSGYCDMVFDINAQGIPYNIVAKSCTSNILERSAKKAVSKWKYNAKVVNGRNVPYTGVRTRIKYLLKDERGNMLKFPRTI